MRHYDESHSPPDIGTEFALSSAKYFAQER
jgi:hypothetical protein